MILLCGANSYSMAEGQVPGFLEKGKTYTFVFDSVSDIVSEVKEIDTSGWVKVEIRGEDAWLNLSKVLNVKADP